MREVSNNCLSLLVTKLCLIIMQYYHIIKKSFDIFQIRKAEKPEIREINKCEFIEE